MIKSWCKKFLCVLLYFLMKLNPSFYIEFSNRFMKYSKKTSIFLLHAPKEFQYKHKIKTLNSTFYYQTNQIDDLQKRSRNYLREWEPISREKFFQLATSSDLVIDIGAYTGIYTLISAMANKNCKVMAFEPNPAIFQNLKFNIKLNDLDSRVQVYNFAISNMKSEQYLYYPKNSTSSASINFSEDFENCIKIKTELLDDLVNIKTSKKVLMKIDVEGHEIQVLQGSQKLIQDSKPIIMMEALSTQQLAQQYLFLSHLGYSVCKQVDRYNLTDSINYIWINEKNNFIENLGTNEG